MFESRAYPWFAAVVAMAITPPAAAQDVASVSEGAGPGRLHFDRAITLDDVPRRSTSVSVADFNADGVFDIVLLNGRHWPEPNRIFFGEGGGAFAPGSNLGEVEDRSYTGAVADFDGDGDLDIAVSNDRPDASYLLLNDGRGRFAVGGTFGQPDWSTRNIAVSDLDGDGSPDIVVANRGPLAGPSPNHVCFNDGAGRFTRPCLAFSEESATTITPRDVDRDGLIDLIVPSRDCGQSHVYRSRSGTRIDLAPVPFGPADASIRAALAADVDGDGLVDIVAIHTGNSEGGDGTVDRGRRDQGTVIYHGMPGGFAEGVPITGSDAAPYALAMADLNGDGRVDILVGHVQASSTVLLDRGDGFEAIPLGDSEGTTYGFATADLDGDGRLDIVVAKTDARSLVFFGSPASQSSYARTRQADAHLAAGHGTSSMPTPSSGVSKTEP